MATVKKLTKIGNSYGVIIPKGLLQVVGIDEQTSIRVEVRKNELVFRPINLKDHKVLKTFQSVVDDYDAVLKRLAK